MATTPRDGTMLVEFAEPERQRALERFRQLRAHLEQDAPLASIADEAKRPYEKFNLERRA